ncbi:MAG TPA: Gfo/Idh/MocA family oxidoreductase [Phycisphaerae bacterium]|nr:Gfo/Idh/MocA family oxidoreductase [Phycisphaerae bacterium]HOQ84139.1 Gfo/Idh/MocA family oxidoreductase [Phycisphaerae bacterium]HPU28187.1 Gfo/Idh/MocA family oxidoreductase [Phycisphaerae bacterium]
MSNVSHRISRRRFLRTSGAVAAATAMTARSYAQTAGANDRLNLALVGCGGIAKEHRGALLKLRESDNLGILAVCDVYEKRAKEFQAAFKEGGAGEPAVFKDYHDILAMKDIDCVVFCTPEHWHARNILDSLDAGKHVYVEKPMTHTIPEALAVVEKAKKTGLKVQVGVQGMSDESYIRAHEAIAAGKLGPVVHAQIEYCRNYDINEGPWRGRIETHEKPADLDWDMWLGPAPKRPWSAARYFEWRNYKDYSGGVGTDLFVHRLCRIVKACGLKFPRTVLGQGGVYIWKDDRELPDNFQMVADYDPVEGITPGMTVHILGTMANRFRYDHAIRGHKATLLFGGGKGGFEIIEERTGKVLETYQRVGGEDMRLHHHNHHLAIRDGVELNCPPELGLYVGAAVRMANLSWFQNRLLAWDDKASRVVPADQLYPPTQPVEVG